MARARLISGSLGGSRRFHALNSVAGHLAEFSQLLFTLIVVRSDDWGRLTADPQSVKFQVFPCSPRSFPEFERALDALDAVGLIALYDIDGSKYLQVNHFEEHQLGLHKRTASKLPKFSGKFREIPTTRARAEEKGTELNRTEGKGTELNRKERGGAAALSQDRTNEDGSSARKSSAARAARSTKNNGKIDPEAYRVIVKVAHEVIEQIGPKSTDLPEAVKSLCAQRHIAYDSGVVQRAIASAIVQRKSR